MASDRYRRAIASAEAFDGLEAGMSRFDLLLLVKRAGREAGFTSRMTQLLEYYLTVLTRDIDWEEGRPIVYQGLSKTALELCVSERQIQKLEKALFEVGAIGYVDSGNCRRYGQRDPVTGQIDYAFGVDLSPLAAMRMELEEAVRRKQDYTRQWHGVKRDISAARRQIRALILEWGERHGERSSDVQRFESEYEAIAVQLRTHFDLDAMHTLLERHQSLLKAIRSTMGVGDTENKRPTHRPPIAKTTAKSSSANTPSYVHYKYTNQAINNCSRIDQGFQKSVTASPESLPAPSSCGVEHVTLRQLERAASERLRCRWPTSAGELTWPEVVEAAYSLREDLGISQASWGEACALMGRTGAALCLLVTDRGAAREHNRVRKPAAYFRGLVERAASGELHLHRSIFGLLEREA